jgi:hypothetical protein
MKTLSNGMILSDLSNLSAEEQDKNSCKKLEQELVFYDKLIKDKESEIAIWQKALDNEDAKFGVVILGESFGDIKNERYIQAFRSHLRDYRQELADLKKKFAHFKDRFDNGDYFTSSEIRCARLESEIKRYEAKIRFIDTQLLGGAVKEARRFGEFIKPFFKSSPAGAHKAPVAAASAAPAPIRRNQPQPQPQPQMWLGGYAKKPSEAQAVSFQKERQELGILLATTLAELTITRRIDENIHKGIAAFFRR